jgi:hypothetical protein
VRPEMAKIDAPLLEPRVVRATVLENPTKVLCSCLIFGSSPDTGKPRSLRSVGLTPGVGGDVPRQCSSEKPMKTS